jgi:proteasome lid subunit RPN8/RPN11
MKHFKTKSRAAPPTLLARARPDDHAGFVAFAARGENFRAYVHTDALAYIAAVAREAVPDETIGLLAGRVCYDPQQGPYTLVMCADTARPGEFEATSGYVHISAEGHARVRRRIEESSPDREVVGWFHSHPSYVARFSPVDEREQATWTDSNHLGIVFSVSEPEDYLGVYRGPGSVLLQPLSSLPALGRRGAKALHAPVNTALPQLPAPPVSPPPQEADVPSPSPAKPLPPRPVTRAKVNGPFRAHQLKRLTAGAPWLLALLALALVACMLWLHGRVRTLERRVNAAATTHDAAAPARTADEAQPTTQPTTQLTPAALDESPPSSPAKALAPSASPVRNPTQEFRTAARRSSAAPRLRDRGARKRNVAAAQKRDAVKKDDADAARNKKEGKATPKESAKPEASPP